MPKQVHTDHEDVVFREIAGNIWVYCEWSQAAPTHLGLLQTATVGAEETYRFCKYRLDGRLDTNNPFEGTIDEFMEFYWTGRNPTRLATEQPET